MVPDQANCSILGSNAILSALCLTEFQNGEWWEEILPGGL